MTKVACHCESRRVEECLLDEITRARAQIDDLREKLDAALSVAQLRQQLAATREVAARVADAGSAELRRALRFEAAQEGG